MHTERGGIVGPAGKFGRASQADAGKGLFGFFALHFDADAAEGDAEFELTDLGNGRGEVKHVATGAYYGVDMTRFSDDLRKVHYLKPSDPGGNEQPWLLRHPASGTKILLVEHAQPDGGQPFFPAPPVAWVAK